MGKRSSARSLLAVGVTLAGLCTAAQPLPTARAAEPGACAPHGVAGEQVVDFEAFAVGSLLDEAAIPPGIRFVPEDAASDLVVVEPTWADLSDLFTRPPVSRRLLNSPGMREYGSLDLPLRIRFDPPADAVALSAGLLTLAEPFTATLTAYGVDAGGGREAVTADSETLGDDGVTPVCLSVEAPGRIWEVTLDYDRPGGVVEPELIDDVVVRFPEVPTTLPADTSPPRVAIESPPAGGTWGGAAVRLQGKVVEDRELADGDLWVNGTRWGALGFTPTGGANYAFAVEALPASALVSCGENLLEVRARDAAGNEGAAEVRFVFRPGDLRVAAAEPVQVLYGAPLVAGKATAFRVVVDSTFPCEVEAEFRLLLPEGEWDTSLPRALPGLALDPAEWRMPEVSGPVVIPPNAAGFGVMLPYQTPEAAGAAWDPVRFPFGTIEGLRAVPRPSAGTASFAVEVDPGDTVAEADEGNNSYASGAYRVIGTRGIRVVFLAQVWDHEDFVNRRSDHGWPEENGYVTGRLPGYAEEQMDYLRGVYPVADAKVVWDVLDTMYFRSDYRDFYQANGCWPVDLLTGVGREEACNSCFLSLMASMVQAEESTSDAHAVAAVRPYGCCGCNDGGGLPSFYVEDDGSPDGNLAHELGHQDIGAWDCYACTYADGRRGCVAHGGLTCESCFADEGFWVNRWQPYSATARYYMDCVQHPLTIWTRLGPCETRRGAATRAGYLELIELLADEADPEVVVVRGTLSSAGAASFQPFLRVERAVADLAAGSAGSHQFVFLDDGGEAQARYGFTPEFTRYPAEPEGQVAADTFRFSYRVPWVEGTAAIELQDAAGAVLARRPVSAHAPTVELVSPNGGEQWAPGEHLVRWAGADADGDALSYALWISMDDGATWQPLAIDLSGDSHVVDTAAFAPGNGFRLKVRVTDGVNTGADASAGAFAVLPAAAGGAGRATPWALGGAGLLALLGAALIGFGIRRRRRAVAPLPPPAPQA